MECSVLAEKDRRRAPKACSFLVIVGWLVLAGSVVFAALFGYLAMDVLPSLERESGIKVAYRVAELVFMGFVALLVAQFVSFVFGASNRTPLLLRHGDKVLFFYAAITCLKAFLGPFDQGFAVVAVMVVILGPTILVCVGIGIALPKVVAAIDELKRLV